MKFKEFSALSKKEQKKVMKKMSQIELLDLILDGTKQIEKDWDKALKAREEEDILSALGM